MDAQALPPVQRHQFTTTDPDHALAFIRQNYADYSVRFPDGPAGFIFAHSMTSSHSFSVGRAHYGMVVKARSEPLEKLFIVQLLSGFLQFSVGQETVCATRAQPVLLSPSRVIHAEWDDYEIGMVMLDPAMVADHAAGAVGIHPASLDFTGMEPVSPLMAQHWRSVVHHTARDVLPNPEAMASPLIVGQTQRLLASSLLTTFPNTALTALTDSPTGLVEPAAVRRAVAFIDAHPGEDIGIAEIARAARVGPRGLQHAFRRYRDTTPMEYLRQVRLHHAHRELLAGDPTQGDTVSAITARWGFPHAGRFSKTYRDTYGRSPHQTLHQ
ncbi:MAG TPA: AraC family transcriptional regulator [Pseudonocardiaceae bacterium]|nr:AraC family transcriptional regulator [Pseudonocardiaceae bacterium]